MNILADLKAAVTESGVPVETGVFSGTAPDEYAVITPLADIYPVYADNRPQEEVQEARVSLYSKGNYVKTRNRLVRVFLEADFTITDRRYVEHEDDTGYHHYAIDVAKNYGLEE